MQHVDHVYRHRKKVGDAGLPVDLPARPSRALHNRAATIPMRVLGRSHVVVPTHLYKVIIVEMENSVVYAGTPALWLGGFILPNHCIPMSVPISTFFAPVPLVEMLAGFYFFDGGWKRGELGGADRPLADLEPDIGFPVTLGEYGYGKPLWQQLVLDPYETHSPQEVLRAYQLCVQAASLDASLQCPSGLFFSRMGALEDQGSSSEASFARRVVRDARVIAAKE